MRLRTIFIIGAVSSIPLSLAGWLIVRTIVSLLFYFMGMMFSDIIMVTV